MVTISLKLFLFLPARYSLKDFYLSLAGHHPYSYPPNQPDPISHCQVYMWQNIKNIWFAILYSCIASFRAAFDWSRRYGPKFSAVNVFLMWITDRSTGQHRFLFKMCHLDFGSANFITNTISRGILPSIPHLVNYISVPAFSVSRVVYISKSKADIEG